MKHLPNETFENGSPTISVDDFYADMKSHQYIYAPAREIWPAVSVDARLEPIGDGKLPASKWIAKHRPVEQLTWWPGYPQIIKDKLINEGGWIDHPGATVFNLYLGPKIGAGNSAQAARWIEHVRKVYPNDADHIIKWLAQRRQNPQEKINHAGPGWEARDRQGHHPRADQARRWSMEFR